MRPEAEELARLAGIEAWRAQIDLIAHELPRDSEKAMNVLLELDSTIPGLGQHNVDVQATDGHWTGAYRVQDRPIFRGIQYVGARLEMRNLEWLSRMVVTESCYHVENSLKRKTGINGNLSVGMILKRIESHSPLDSGLSSSLSKLNEMVYNKAKHTIEDIDMDSHMFSVSDAIAIYFVCRILGAKLLKGLGITAADGRILFP